MKDIPLIDLSASATGPAGERDVAMQIDHACRDVGFFTVCGHGIDRAVFDDAYRASQRFFALPDAAKRSSRLPTGITSGLDDYTPYGYSGLLEENAFAYMGQDGKPADYVEKFSTGRLILDDAAPLPFPEGDEGADLRRALKRYFAACEQVAQRLTALLTIALDLPRDFFLVRTDRSNDSLRSQRYPQADAAFANDQGMGEHTDGTLVTLLTHTVPGIEVRTRAGEWLIPSMRGLDHFIVNIGDLMARWSNDVYVSTPHRVALRAAARQSIVFFKLANDDALIECFPKFCRTEAARYAPVVYKQFSLDKMNALFGRGAEPQPQ
ncbi:isopenicillin synthase [Burkholderia ubonensis]|uniref:isopenicillin N synthase family dioxygenase n=1 Tax=Burkholderia ubonensis TaxID=101571 RepID=UPI000754871E|nr:2-oxoglutarate and iron-dependent oxygenase domain-containing protein [Burkholderia ubonensis]KVC69946.1 isopenicillin synthase [Burkholderia ubonensis]